MIVPRLRLLPIGEPLLPPPRLGLIGPDGVDRPALMQRDRETWWLVGGSYTITLNDGAAITVPNGYVFDLASIPRLLWWALAPNELSVPAPLVHDFLYEHHGVPPAGACQPWRQFTRRQVDGVFLDVMRCEGVKPWRAAPAYRAVRMFAGPYWRRRRRPDFG